MKHRISIRPLEFSLQDGLAALRALVRTSEVWLVTLASLIGALAGVLVAAMSRFTQRLHELLFAIEPHQQLSGVDLVPAERALLVPICGGLILGLLGLGLARWRSRQPVDPIEANALHGGRMSITDSLIVAVQTLVSNGFGGSVGLEAGYTQIGSGLASRIGIRLRLRRNDLRTLVGCGAAGAIAAAFNAPLTGAAYAFELIIGSYSVATLAPVVAAAVAGTLVTHALINMPTVVQILTSMAIRNVDYLTMVVLGILCGLVGIGIMYAVTLAESAFRRSRIPAPLRPVIGGLVLGGLALVSPRVLSSGHGALHLTLESADILRNLVLIFLLKSAASAISLGSGFRGGLFFASLFLGALLGQIFAQTLALFDVPVAVQPVVFTTVGMGALAVAIIGGPLTMTFLALEVTGDFAITAAVLIAVVAASITVRELFGYSFATWRFHLRGESIRSAHDVGWIRNLTVGRIMRRDVRTVYADGNLAAFRRQFPLGSAKRVVAVDKAERYAGIVDVAEAHSPDLDDAVSTTSVADLLHHTRDFLLPQMNVKEAVMLFDQLETETLAVLDGAETRRVIGLLNEAHALRRYSEELDQRRREAIGEL
jgi:CIC family chloride channel protein